MNAPVIYRRRLIPDECVLLDKDKVLYVSKDFLVTSWETIRPKKLFCRGVSAYFWEKGIKLSKFYDCENRLYCWYFDVLTHEFSPEDNAYRYLDLLVDVLIFPDGRIQVVDMDELADAFHEGLLTSEQMEKCLRTVNWLLQSIYSGEIRKYQDFLEEKEKWN